MMDTFRLPSTSGGPRYTWQRYMGMTAMLINVLLGGEIGISLSTSLASAQTNPPQETPAIAAPIKVVAFGDSLTAGYMLPPPDAFPAQLAAALKAKGYAVDIANAGVSGDTTANGLERLDWSIPAGTEAVILELGANDGLRGLPPETARKNLEAILSKLKDRSIVVLIAGITAPQNWGANYAEEFNAMYADLSTKYGALLYPFFLDGIALKPELNLSDGLHPTGKGVGVIVERIMPSVEALLGRVQARRSAG